MNLLLTNPALDDAILQTKKRLHDSRLEHLRGTARSRAIAHADKEYQRHHQVQSNLQAISTIIDQFFCSYDALPLKRYIRSSISMYINTNQYHNAEHVLQMMLDSAHLMKNHGILLSSEEGRGQLKRSLIAGMNHDREIGRAHV